MSGRFVYINGQPVARGTAAAFRRMAAAFKKRFGLDLLITSGYRSYAQQKSLYDRWKAGTFHAPSVARPGTSRHENGRALDLRDSGSTAGVTMAGNPRSNWLRNNCSRWGFVANGYSFREPWHYEYQGDPWAGSGSSSGASGRLAVDGLFGPASVRRLQSVLGTVQDGYLSGQSSASKRYHSGLRSVRYGSGGSTAVRALQRKLKVSADGYFGPQTIRAWQRKLGVTADGYFGPNTAKAAQRMLNQNKLW